MGGNYYEVLGVPKGTSDEAAIKKAYKKSALKFHPDRPGGDKVKFQEVSEAFEVLSDARKKQLYDRFGEAGLSPGGGEAPDDDVGSGGGGGGGDSGRRPGANPFSGRGGAGGGGGQTFSFGTTTGGRGGGGGGRGSNFHGSDPFSVFESIFGTMDVDQAMGAGGAGGDGFSGFSMRGMNGMRMGGSPTNAGGGFGGMAMPGMSSGGMPATSSSTRQAPPVEHTLNLTLEELFRGTSKRVRITKKTATGEAKVDKTIVIKPGWKDGTRITFQREGDEQPNMLPSDIIFVIKTKLHPRFTRKGNDLSCTVLITLEQALSGFDLPVDTLDGRTVIASEPGIASSSHQTVIRGEGMPSQKDRRVRGDLTVRYSVEFPPPVRSQADKRKRQQAIADL